MNPHHGKQSESEPEAVHNLPRALDREVKGMVTTIRHHIADIHKPGGTHQQHLPLHHFEGDSEADSQGMGVVTLSGTNSGATMRVLPDQKPATPLAYKSKLSSYLGNDEEDDGALDDHDGGTYVNSNFQAVNNSIMMNSNYSTNDPGVHLDISDEVDHSSLQTMDKYSMKELLGKKKKKDKTIIHESAALSE